MTKCLCCKKEFDPRWMNNILPLGAPDIELCKPCLIETKQNPKKLSNVIQKLIKEASTQAKQSEKTIKTAFKKVAKGFLLFSKDIGVKK